MHKLTIALSDKSGYNYDLINDKDGKIIHSWKNPKMLRKWIDGYVPGNGQNFIQYVEKNGSAKIKIKPNKFVIPFRETKMNEKLDPKQLIDAIKMFQKKIEKQGRVTNARDEEHLERLLKLYKDMGGRKKFESVNELEYKPIALDDINKKSQEIGKDFRKMAHSISKDLDTNDNRVVGKCLKVFNNYFALLKQMNKVLK